jgi:hypothetical protein
MKNALLSPSVCMSQNNLLRLYKSWPIILIRLLHLILTSSC